LIANLAAGPLLALAMASASPPQAGPAAGSTLSPESERLWEQTVAPRLQGDRWSDAGRYDAAHIFMLPMHAAFARHFQKGERDFAQHVRRFFASRNRVDLSPATQLSWLQYFYLVSRFLVLSASYGHPALIPEGLPSQMRSWVEEVWSLRPAPHWTEGPFQGVGERVRWKLVAGTPGVGERAYPRAILDSEIFLFAIAADLRQYGRLSRSPLATDPLLDSIAALALEVYRRRVAWHPEGGWTFQPGVWRDHPNYRYACRNRKEPGMRPCMLPDVAEDASHSHRAPLWLRSLADGSPRGSPERAYYRALARSLEEQFFARVVEPPSAAFDGWRLRNFMDGRNGIYRWGYRSLGPNQGYGPYELSGALVHGWWSFLPGGRTRRLYAELSAQFPLSREQLLLYAGPRAVAREGRDPATGILGDGTAELLSRLALELD
jgi:hypothetical protein